MASKIRTIITCEIWFEHDESWDPDELVAVTESMIELPSGYAGEGMDFCYVAECKKESSKPIK